MCLATRLEKMTRRCLASRRGRHWTVGWSTSFSCIIIFLLTNTDPRRRCPTPSSSCVNACCCCCARFRRLCRLLSHATHLYPYDAVPPIRSSSTAIFPHALRRPLIPSRLHTRLAGRPSFSPGPGLDRAAAVVRADLSDAATLRRRGVPFRPAWGARAILLHLPHRAARRPH